MSREDLIRIAREARMPYFYQTKEIANLDGLERFANLVVAAEREACAVMFDDRNVWDEEVGERIRARGTT